MKRIKPIVLCAWVSVPLCGPAIVLAQAAHGENKRGAVPRAHGMATRAESPRPNPPEQAASNGSCSTARLCGETAILVGSDTHPLDQFGASLALDQDVLVVGAQLDYAGAYYSGSAYVFRRDGSAWVEEDHLAASDISQEMYFGSDVAVSQDVIVVGAPEADIPGGGYSNGAAYVYRWNGTDWLEEAKLTAPNPAEFARFGSSVAIDADLIMAGAPYVGLESRVASVFFFRYENGIWARHQQIRSPTNRYTARFGLAVALAGDVAVVGEVEDDRADVPHATAYAFRRIGGLFSFEQQFNLGDECSLVFSVATDSVVAVVGATRCTSSTSSGAAYVYRFDGLSWNQEATLTASDAPSDRYFGGYVAVNGNRIAVAGVDAAYLYRYEAGVWVEEGKVPSTQYLGVVSDVGIRNGILAVAHYTRDSVSLYDVTVDGPDCDCDGISDACEIVRGMEPDCNANLIVDGCDIESGSSLDCNVNLVPDECDISDKTSTDANGNGIPDECDTNLPAFIIEQPAAVTACGPSTVVFRVLAGGMPPFTYQWRKDMVELSGETFDTLTLPNVTAADEGDYDVVVTNDLGSITSDQAALVLATLDDVAPDPTGIAKTRFISMSIPGGGELAVRVTLTSLHHVVPPYSGWYTIPFTALEGQVRWVGPPAQYSESTADGTTFMAAALQCQPYYQDWSTVGLLHVTGSEIVPSSVYDVQVFDLSCQGNEANCRDVSCSTQIKTSRWCEVVAAYQDPNQAASQPDFNDIGALVNKFKSAPGAPIKARAMLAGEDARGLINLTPDLGFGHISACVDGFKGLAYPYKPGKCAGAQTMACITDADCGANGPCILCP